MVRLAGFAAVNDEQARRPAEPVGETVEAQESRLANQYQRALLHEQKGEARAAEADLRQLLYDEPAVKASGSSAFLRQLRHLVLRNLGGLLVQSDDTAEEALRMYVEALEVDPDDVVLWHRAGTLAAELGLWGVARLLFEYGLRSNPSLAVQLMQLGDLLQGRHLSPAMLLTLAELQLDAEPIPSQQQASTLRELHDATCRFEALPLDRQQELLQSSRISAHISSLQWQLAHLLQLYLPHASNLQPASEQAATAQETCAVAATLLSTETDCQKLQGIAAQCLYFLYDVDIAHRNAAWGQSEQAPSEHLKPDTDQEAARLFRHLRLYADAHSEDAKGLQVLGKLEGAFDLILGHYGQPAEDSQAASAVQALLDDADFSTDFICGSTRAELVERLMCLTTATCVDDHCQARHRIYYWKMLLRDTLSDELDAPDLILQPVGDAVIDEITLFCRLDISHQPDSLSSWERLAVLYRDTAEAIRWEMAKAVAPEDWPRQTSLLARLAAYEARAEKAGLITRLLTANAVNQDDLANISEVLGLQYYHQLQGGPPASNQRQRTSLQDGAYAECCRRCQSAYEQAARILPDEWQFPYFIGKMQSKLGAPPEQVLHSFALACRNAKLYAGGQLEPLYRLHATRLKMLLSGVVPVSLLHRHCFQSGADHHPADAGTTSQGSDVFQLLLNDCLGALRYCLKHRPWFHKAQYRLAVALWHQQSPEAAVSELRQLFSRGRKQFTIFLWKIIDDEDPERQAYAASRMEHVAEVDSDVPEEEWGQQPVKLSGIGLEETDRKSFTAARRYAVQYLRLLHITGDVATLHAATLGLQQPQSSEANASRRWSDIARLAHGYYLVTLNQLLLKRLKSANGASPAAEGVVHTGFAGKWQDGPAGSAAQQAAQAPQKPGDVPSRASNEHADAAMPKDADVSQATNAASDAPSQPDDIAAETRPAQLTDAPSQRLSSDESDPAGSPSLLTSPEPGSQSPTKRQGAIAEDRPHAEACQQQAVGRSMAEASQGGPGKDLAAAVVSAEEEAALRWQHNVLQLMQLMRHAVAMWKLAQQLQPDHKGRKRTGAVFLLVSPLTPAGMEADVADDPAALLDVAATNLCRSYRRAEATLIAAPVQDGHVTPEDALATCEGLLKQIKKLPPSSVHLLTWKSCPT
ncbi:hypothetical protein WJX84_006779 [Apatococcus fuscideae]|uniref:Uncharacterized protein n=1 Tax=Apatococcus fuscideae TaxID=2026836 RepID=A0AAW1TEX5_9CHLO